MASFRGGGGEIKKEDVNLWLREDRDVSACQRRTQEKNTKKRGGLSRRTQDKSEWHNLPCVRLLRRRHNNTLESDGFSLQRWRHGHALGLFHTRDKRIIMEMSEWCVKAWNAFSGLKKKPRIFFVFISNFTVFPFKLVFFNKKMHFPQTLFHL